MFKKSLEVSGTNLLSKKDVKKLRSSLLAEYPALEGGRLDALLPVDAAVKMTKLASRTILYGIGDGAPLFFDEEGRGDIFPTLNGLWAEPSMMPELIIHPDVSKYILNGADVMLPGVMVPANGFAGFGTVEKNQKRCVKVDGNPYPVCVGKMLVNQNGMEKMKGKGMSNLHVYGDELWAFCGRVVPNAGFSNTPDAVESCSDLMAAAAAPAAGAASGSAAAAGDASPPAAASRAEAKAAAAPSGGYPSATAAPLAPADAGEAASQAAPATDGATAEADRFASMSQDELLEFCALKAFLTTLAEDSQLPVAASDFQEKHLIPARPAGTTVDVKRSSHKQLGKFLNAMRKQKLIEVVDKKGAVSITKVMREHRDLKGFEAKYGKEAVAAAEPAESSAAKEKADKGGSKRPPPVITTKWKASHYLEALFKECRKSKSELYTMKDIQGSIKEYLDRKELLEEEVVQLDDLLFDALFKVAGGKKKDAPEDTKECTLDELFEKLEERLQEHTVVEMSTGEQCVRKGPLQPISMTLSRKGAHNVTRIAGLETFCVDPEPLAKTLKTFFSCTTSVEDMPGKNTKDKMLQVQGHVAQDLIEYLEREFGIERKHVEVK